jgi:hypothetical protein
MYILKKNKNMTARKHVKKNKIAPCTDANQRVRESILKKKKQIAYEQRKEAERMQRLQAEYEARLAAQKNATVEANNQMMSSIPQPINLGANEPVSITAEETDKSGVLPETKDGYIAPSIDVANE